MMHRRGLMYAYVGPGSERKKQYAPIVKKSMCLLRVTSLIPAIDKACMSIGKSDFWHGRHATKELLRISRMNILICLIVIMGVCIASDMEAAKEKGVSAALSASEAGKGVFAQEVSGFNSFNSWGITVNPNYQQSNNPQELESQASHMFYTDKMAQMIHDGHKTREFRTIDLDHLEIDANGLIKSMGEGGLDPEETFEIKTCRSPGETYTSTCKRQRIVEIKVIPEEWGSQRYCPGHAKKERKGWSLHYSHWTEYCGGCTTRQVKTREKQLNILRDEWVGCEAEDKNHEEGLCELIDEQPGPHNEIRMMQGEEITRDYWESTRVYRCGVKGW